jgi:RNA polymerase sigma-32 factor
MDYMHSAAFGSNPLDDNVDEESFETGADLAASYRDKVFEHPNLEADEEFALAKRWREDGDYSARDKLITTHLKLVQRMAAKYCSDMSVDDAVSEGTIELIRAVDLFDPSKGFRLATYAWSWIRSGMIRYRNQSRSIVKNGAVPDFELDAASEAENEDGGTWQDRVAFDGVDTVLAKGRNEKGSNICQLRAHQEAILADAEFRNALTEVMNSALNQRERYVFQERYFSGKRREDLSRELGVSRERIRQIENRALQKVQKAAENLDGAGAGAVRSLRRAA